MNFDLVSLYHPHARETIKDVVSNPELPSGSNTRDMFSAERHELKNSTEFKLKV